MKKEKNNAVEKVENALNNNKNKKSYDKTEEKNNKSIKSDKKRDNQKTQKNEQKTNSENKKTEEQTTQKDKKAKMTGKEKQKKEKKEKEKAERIIKRNQKKEEKRNIKLMREKERAQKKIELAKIKAQKQAEKEKAQAAAIREKNRKREERLKRKEEIKAEKEKRKDLIKKELKEQKEKNKQKNREKNRGLGGWLAAVISLSVITVVLGSVLTYTFLTPSANDRVLESNYQRAFYDTVTKVDNMDLNLSKALATKDSGAMQKYLVDLAINSELAENDIQQLPLKDENKFYTTKLINQIGDYSKYLNKKIIDDKEITDSDYSSLQRLYEHNLALKNALQVMREKMGSEFAFGEMIKGDNIVLSNFNQLENLSVEYPELIYDGPFSDGKDRKDIKGIDGEQISDKLALQKFNAIFSDYDLVNVRTAGNATSNIECYNIQGEKGGNLLYAQISKKGGKLIMFAYAGSCNAKNYQQDAAIDKASAFLNKNGLADMKAVWVNLSNNVYTINYASEIGDIIVYPDMIKVRVCAETGMVIGLEATSYYTNHTNRLPSAAAITKKQAENKVSANIDIDTTRLVIVPVGENTEKLCYEISGSFDGSTYYVYIDAISGRQVEMFKVVKSSEGTLLM